MTVTTAPGDLDLGEVFGQLDDAVIVADVSCNQLVLWNRAAEELFGYSAVEVLGQPAEWLLPERLRAERRLGLIQFRDKIGRAHV